MGQRQIDYSDGTTGMSGILVTPDSGRPVPGVLVAHDWTGRNDFALNVATQLAELGYAAFAMDMYGNAQTADTVEGKAALMAPLKENRGLLMQRVNAAFNTMIDQPEVDRGRTGAVGFCFGGLVVLDLARSGASVGGVVSFHGFLDAPEQALCKPITAQVLALHGYQDPMVPPAVLPVFEAEMANAGVDFQLHIYGRAVHAFTNPHANDPSFGTVYDDVTRNRAFRTMQGFFADLFG